MLDVNFTEVSRLLCTAASLHGHAFFSHASETVEHALSLQNSPPKKKYPLRNRLKTQHSATDHEVLFYYSLTWPYIQLVL